ncbi:MAG: DUF4097 family beta strand repeat protein [Parasporobacterium sp.]|nr:DUF4097 family beta strand repeat protein [Parasporobacterium sp.]
MSRDEYLKKLQQDLDGCENTMVQEVLQAFEEHFAEGLSRGMTEEEIVQELGDVRDVAAQLREMEPASAGAGDAADPEKEPVNSQKPEKGTGPESGSELRNGSEPERGPRPEVSCLIVETLHSGTDVHLSEGSEFSYQIEPVQGITLGSGLFLPSRIFGTKQEPEVACEIFGRECRISVRRGGGKLEISVPASIREVRLQMSSGDAKAAGLKLERLNGRSSSGDLTLDQCEAMESHLKTVSGDVRIRDCRIRKMEMECVSGDITVDSCRGELMLQSVSGDISVKEHTGGAVEGKTKSGDVELSLADPELNADVSSMSGNVGCTVTGCDFTAVLSTKSGTLKNKTSILGRGNGKELQVGMGTAKIRLKSISGNVILS